MEICLVRSIKTRVINDNFGSSVVYPIFLLAIISRLSSKLKVSLFGVHVGLKFRLPNRAISSKGVEALLADKFDVLSHQFDVMKSVLIFLN